LKRCVAMDESPQTGARLRGAPPADVVKRKYPWPSSFCVLWATNPAPPICALTLARGAGHLLRYTRRSGTNGRS
jgi:hypothetical protein